TLFPYTTLFRSRGVPVALEALLQSLVQLPGRLSLEHVCIDQVQQRHEATMNIEVHGRGNEFCRNLCDIVYGRTKPDRSDIPEPVTINLDHYPIVLSSDLDVSHALSPSMQKEGAAHHPSLTSVSVDFRPSLASITSNSSARADKCLTMARSLRLRRVVSASSSQTRRPRERSWSDTYPHLPRLSVGAVPQ